MFVKEAVVARFLEICSSRDMSLNELANISGVTPSTVYSMLDQSRRNISINTIKKLCDGLDVTLGKFFSTSYFDDLDQELI